MKFIIQTVNNQIESVETFQLKGLLDDWLRKINNSYTLRDNMSGINEKGLIPVGDLDFVGEYLKNAYGIENMNPIEVPNCLRKYDYLKRVYEVSDEKTIINHYNSGRKLFVKKVDKLKEYNNSLTGIISPDVLPEGTYIVSSWMNIVSEYRVFVLEDTIVGCKHYSGDCMIFPDNKLIGQMVNVYSLDKDRPKAYTLDIAVSVVANGYETIILEVHPFVSCGTYGFDCNDLIYMYRYGLDYYIDINKKLE